MKNVLCFTVLVVLLVTFSLSIKPRLANSDAKSPVNQVELPDPQNPEKPVVQKIMACKTWPAGTLTMRVVSENKIMFEVQTENNDFMMFPSEEVKQIAIEYAKVKLGDPLPQSKLIFNRSVDGLAVDVINLEKPPTYD